MGDVTREQALEAALLAMVEETCDYMRINNLGDPEKKHNIKRARAALAMPPAQGVDASRAVILSDIEQALPRWIEAMGDWDAGGEQAIDEMQATLDDIRALTPPAQEPSHDR